jgi:hypothetical protein
MSSNLTPSEQLHLQLQHDLIAKPYLERIAALEAELATLKGRRFPIQRYGTVPWAEAERAYGTYHRLYGNEQTIGRLAERGGFGLQEFWCLWLGHDPGRCKDTHPIRNFDSELEQCRQQCDQLRQRAEAAERRNEIHDKTSVIQVLEKRAEAAEKLCADLLVALKNVVPMVGMSIGGRRYAECSARVIAAMQIISKAEQAKEVMPTAGTSNEPDPDVSVTGAAAPVASDVAASPSDTE